MLRLRCWDARRLLMLIALVALGSTRGFVVMPMSGASPCRAHASCAPVIACATDGVPSAAPAAAEPTDADAAAPIITLSERAIRQLEVLREGSNLDEIILRMGVRAGGCSGMSYVMDLAKPEDVSEEDTIVEIAADKKAVIDPKSLMFVYGMRLDYSDELIGGGFSFQNPNAEETCGCGKSFGV